MADRVLPHDLAAERAVLGSMMLDRHALLAASTALTEDDYHAPKHARIHEAILQVDARSEGVDALTVSAQLARNGHPDDWATSGGLSEIIADVPSTRNVETYARQVVRLHSLRQVIATASDMLDAAFKGSKDPDRVIEDAQEAVYQLGETRRGNHAEPAATAVARVLEHLEKLAETPGDVIGIPTGIVDLDRKLAGLQPGQLVTICARPGMGKSVLGAQIAMHAATAANTGTLLVTVEMSVEEITSRMIAGESNVDLQQIRTGQFGPNDWPRITKGATSVGNSNLWFLDAGTSTIPAIRSELRRLKSRRPIGLMIVDYLQLLQSHGRRENRQVEVSDLSAGLKRMAREMHIPVVALAQLNRGLEVRGEKKPTLADIRESGAIENDSDVVIGIYRADYYDKTHVDAGTAELCILKQRNGPTGDVRVGWDALHGRFTNLTNRQAA